MVNPTDLEALPPVVHVDPQELADTVTASGRVLVVLDDDPTGTQSVSDLPVLSGWSVDDLIWALEQGKPAVYVLTNSRSLDPAEAERVNREVARHALEASRRTGVPVGFVSRSDSTLRGHFPLETDVLAEELVAAGQPQPNGVVMVPAFPDAGRITVDSVHYYRTGEVITPVAETEFARDATFGFSHSDLREYVAEKTAGRTTADQVLALPIGTIRRGVEAVVEVLRGAHDATPVVVDVVVEDDMRVVSAALQRLEDEGMSFLYRVGPPFVRARIGQAERAPLSAEEVFAELEPSSAGGLVVVGSHVALTTRQLTHLAERDPQLQRFEIDVPTVLEPGRRDDYLAGLSGQVAEALGRGNVVVNTSRVLTTGTDADDSLRIAREVSAAVVAVVRAVLAARPPRFVIAKGGITSSDVASRGLGITRAIVRGPMLPGIVSLWEPMEGPATGIPYVVFAGNVGDDSSLAAVVEKLSAH